MTGTQKMLNGKNVLLVEDEFLIAVDAEEMLKSLDAADVEIASTYEEAERHVREGNFDVAVLDVNLNGKLSFPIGEILKERGVPFVFASGYNLDRRNIEGFKGGLWVSKPYHREKLRAGIERALQGESGDA